MIQRIKNCLDVLPSSFSNEEIAKCILNEVEFDMCPSYQIEFGTGYADEYGQEITNVEWCNQWQPESPTPEGEKEGV